MVNSVGTNQISRKAKKTSWRAPSPESLTSTTFNIFVFQQYTNEDKIHVWHFKQRENFIYVFFTHTLLYCLVLLEEILSTSDVVPAFALFWLKYWDKVIKTQSTSKVLGSSFAYVMRKITSFSFLRVHWEMGTLVTKIILTRDYFLRLFPY